MRCWAGNGAGAGICRHIRRIGHLVGAAGACRVLLLALLLFSLRLPLQSEADKTPQSQKGKTALPARFWVFAAFALLYGICETMNGNWASLYMTRTRSEHHPGLAGADHVLGDGNRRAYSFCRHRKMVSREAHLPALPFVVAAAFVIIAFLPKSDPYLGILAFGLAGWAVRRSCR